MEVHVYHYKCIQVGKKKYLQQLTVDSGILLAKATLNLVTFAHNIFTKHRKDFVETDALLPAIEIEHQSYPFAIVGTIYTEFQVEITTPVTQLGKGKSTNLPVKRIARIKGSPVMTEKMILKSIIAAFHESKEPFDKVADEILKKYTITHKKINQ